MDNLPIQFTDNCWLWLGTKTNNGYGVVGGYKPEVAHRHIYKMLVGEIPEGLQLDHLCSVKHCVNPAHLEPVTRLENMQRYHAKFNGLCKQGHPLETGKRQRRCRTCNRAYQRAQKRRLRAL